MRLGIIGNNAFFSWHLRCFFLRIPDFEVLLPEQKLRGEREQLDYLAGKCDAIVFFSDIGRPTLEPPPLIPRVGDKKANIFFLLLVSSGNGDRLEKEADELHHWALKHKVNAAVLVFPEIFGEFAKTEESTVAFISSELLGGSKVKIERNAPISLIYAQEAARVIYKAIRNNFSGKLAVGGREMTVGKVHDMLERFRGEYFANKIPGLASDFEADIFSTFRSYLLDSFYPRRLELKTDERGSLFEIVKSETGGQTTFSSTKAGKVRGNHYHVRKIERFCVVKGEAEIRIRKILTDQSWIYKVRGDEPSFIDMPRFCTHNLKNTGNEDMRTVFWTSEIYDPHDPDTYRDVV